MPKNLKKKQERSGRKRVDILTINQLRQYRKIKGRKLLLEDEFDELTLKIQAIENKDPDKAEISRNERDKLQKDIEYLKQRLDAVEAYLRRCDEYVEVMLRMRYIDGKTWTAIAMKQGGKNTNDSVRKQCHRYVAKNP